MTARPKCTVESKNPELEHCKRIKLEGQILVGKENVNSSRYQKRKSEKQCYKE